MEKEKRAAQFNRMLDLRKKQLLSHLSELEQTELKQLCTSLSDGGDYYEYQMKTEIVVKSIKDLDFVEKRDKPSLFDRILQREKDTYYEMSFDCGGDLHMYGWSFEFALEIKRFMEEQGIHYTTWGKMLPVIMDMSWHERMSLEEVNWLKALPSPSWCAGQLNEVDRLLEKAREHSEDMHEFIGFLKTQWEDGYQIFMDCTEITSMSVC